MKILFIQCICLLVALASHASPTEITNPKIKWAFKTQGTIRASGAIGGNSLYFGSADGFLYAVNKENGSLLWKFQTKGALASTPLVSGDLVIISSRDNNVYAVHSQSGELAWKFEMQPIIKKYTEWEYFISSPVASGTNVFVASGDGNLYALNQSDGKLVWKHKTPDRLRSTPLVADKTIYQACNDGIIYAINIENGKLIWGFKTRGATLDKSQGYDRTNIFSKPCLKDNLLVFGARDGNTYAVDINTGEMKWDYTFGPTWAISTAIDEETVYTGWSTNNTFSAVDLKTGVPKWKYVSGSINFTTAAFQGNHVIFGSADGNLYCLDKKTGKKNWQYNIGTEIHSSPIYDPNTIYVGSDDGFFYALEEGKKVFAAVYNPVPKGGSTSYPLIDEKISSYLKDRDFKQLDSAKLFRFLEDRIKDKAPSVIVFAYDAIPKNMMGEHSEKGMIRQYLDTGGKIIWFGWIPNIHYYDTKGKYVGPPNDIEKASKLLDVKFPTPEESGNYYSKATQEGLNWGLPVWFKATYAVVAPEDVIPLAYNENNNVSVWLKKLNPRPGSGFISMRTWAWDVPMKEEDLELIYHLAMHELK